MKKGDDVWVKTLMYGAFEGTIVCVLNSILGKKYLVKYISTGLDGRNRASADIYYWWNLIKK